MLLHCFIDPVVNIPEVVGSIPGTFTILNVEYVWEGSTQPGGGNWVPREHNFNQVTTQLSSRGWVNPVPYLIHFFKIVEIPGIEPAPSWLIDNTDP